MIDNQFQIMRNQVVIIRMLEVMSKADARLVGPDHRGAILRMNKEKRSTIDNLKKERMAGGLE